MITLPNPASGMIFTVCGWLNHLPMMGSIGITLVTVHEVNTVMATHPTVQ